MKNKRGQAGVEALFAVIILLGMLLVIAVIAVQQQGQADALKTQEEQATLCRQIAETLEAAQKLKGQSNLSLNVTQHAYIRGNTIEFSSTGSGYYCYFNGNAILANPAPEGTEILAGEILSLSPQAYTITKNSANQAVIENFCIPKTCAELAGNCSGGNENTLNCCGSGDAEEGNDCACGTYADECGGRIFCTNSCYCGDGICAGNENSDSCASDCLPVCGNDYCEQGEDETSCPGDCSCGNGTCDTANGETSANCLDCSCGDGICDSSENVLTCPADCSSSSEPTCSFQSPDNGSHVYWEPDLSVPVEISHQNFSSIPTSPTSISCEANGTPVGLSCTALSCTATCTYAQPTSLSERQKVFPSVTLQSQNPPQSAECTNTPTITLDYCGDSEINGSEECDGTDGRTCLDFGFSGGTLSCGSDCFLDFTQCIGVVQLSSCGTPPLGWVDRTTYRVITRLDAGASPCFTIPSTSTNITLECGGYVNTITGRSTLIVVAGSNATIQNCQLSASGANSMGVSVQATGTNALLSNLKILNPQTGISLAASAVVSGNQINATRHGIRSTAGSQLVSSNQITIGGLSDSAHHYGVWLTHGIGQYSTVQGNTINTTNSQSGYNAVSVQLDNGAGNTVSNNTISTTSASGGNGIQAGAIINSTILGNNVCGGNQQTISISSSNYQSGSTNNTCASLGCTHTAGNNSRVCIIASGTIGNCSSICLQQPPGGGT